MKTYDLVEAEVGSFRAHPWTDAVADPNNRYYDFTRDPRLVRTVLEDFTPWARWPAVQTFYRLVEWLNGPGSLFESNDCAFTGPRPNESAEFAKALEVTGRLMILWRHLPYNLSRPQVDWLKRAAHHCLGRRDQHFLWGAIGISVFGTKYVTLPLPEERQAGFQLMLSFWSWGDDEDEVWAHLDRTLRNLQDALAEIARRAGETIRA